MVCNVFVIVTILIFLMYSGCCNFAFCKNWLWFGLLYLFIHSVTYVTMDMSVTGQNLQHIL